MLYQDATEYITNSEFIKKACLQSIDMNTKYVDEYTKMRISAIKSFDNYLHMMLKSYGAFLSQFNGFTNNKSSKN